jgi:hypothetical protein
MNILTSFILVTILMCTLEDHSMYLNIHNIICFLKMYASDLRPLLLAWGMPFGQNILSYYNTIKFNIISQIISSYYFLKFYYIKNL